MIQPLSHTTHAGALAPTDASTDTAQAATTLAADATDAAVPPQHDPLAALASANGLHAHVMPLVGHAADPWAQARQPAGAHSFAGGIVLLGSPLPVTLASPPQKIGGPSAAPLAHGKASGKIIEDLQGRLNMARERLWRDQEGHPGYPDPSKHLSRSGKFDQATVQALKEFQQRMGLPATGVADAATQNLLMLEGDQRYTNRVSETNKQLVRQLIASLGNDAARIDAVTTLLDGNGFATLYDDADQGRVITALINAKADPAFVQNLGKLLNHDQFKGLDPQDKNAVLHYASTPQHANATMMGNVLKMLGNPTDIATLVQLGTKELKAHEAAIAAREPELTLGRHSGTTTHMPSTTGHIPDSAWADPTVLVGQLRQSAVTIDDVNARNRCGPTNLLVAALLQGPDVAARFLDKVAANGNNLTKAEKADLKALADQVRNRNASYEDLSLAMDYAYRAGDRRMGIDQWVSTFPSLMNTPPTHPGLSNTETTRLLTLALKQGNAKPAELQELSRLVSKASGVTMTATVASDISVNKQLIALNYKAGEPGLRNGSIPGGFDDGELRALAGMAAQRAGNVAYDLHGRDPVGSVLQRLKPGESAVIPLSGSPTSNRADHYISVGILKNGRPYIYNPDPFRGDATLTVGRSSGPQTQSFTDELNKYNQRANQSPSGAMRRAILVAP